MKSFIVKGDQKARVRYIEEFCAQNRLKSYNHFEYKEKLKISDSRDLKRHWSIKSDERKLFVFWNEMAIDVQNSLLKSIEELPDNIDIIFSIDVSGTLLPTIISRSFLVTLGNDGTSDIEINEYKKELAKCFEQKDEYKRFFMFLQFIDQIVEKKEENDYLKVILSLRELALEKVKQKFVDEPNFIHIYKMLSLFHEYSNPVFVNNINRRIVFERIVFSLDKG